MREYNLGGNSSGRHYRGAYGSMAYASRYAPRDSQLDDYLNEEEDTGEHQKKGRRKQRKSGRIGRIIKKILLVLLFILLLAFVSAGIVLGVEYRKYELAARRIVREAGETIFKQNQTSVIYDCNGNVITELIGEHDAYYIEYGNIPYFVRQALITSEDRNFYSHSGVDFKAVMRALVVLVQNKGKITQGGSTITQQLARIIFLSHEVSMERKVKEMFIARELEKKYSKEQILEFYINNIYFGNGFYGIEAASRGYFNKSVTELSLAEMAFVCSIPNNPTMYDPFVNGEATLARKNRILRQMYEQQDIDAQMYEEALDATIVLYPAINEKNNYVETYVRYCATIALMQNVGFELEYDFGTKEEQEIYENRFNSFYNQISASLYTGGYKIYTSIDLEKQAKLQEILDEKLSGYQEVNEEGIYTMQGSATCIDNSTGKVVAIVGGRSQEYNGYTLNRAYQSYRQPGSTIKPILIYTPAFERNFYPDTIVTDEPVENGPVNSPNVYEGDMTLRYAVEKSKNTIAWKMFDQIGISTCIQYLKNMDFHRIDVRDYVLPMSIGGMTYGVSTLEMASAYCALENDGMFRTPTCITKITDNQDNIMIDNINYQAARNTTIQMRQIYQDNAAHMMTDVLKGVLISGTGRNYNIDNAICAAKTGTTNDNKDVWFVGYSGYYTTAVWVGYDLPQIINDGYGNTCSGNIWREYMAYLHEGLPVIDFVPYVGEDGRLSNGEETTEEITTESETTEIAIYTESPTDIPPIEITEQNSDENQNQGNPGDETVSEYGGNAGESIGQDMNRENPPTQETTEEHTTEQETTSRRKGNYVPSGPSYRKNNEAPGGADNGVYQEYWG